LSSYILIQAIAATDPRNNESMYIQYFLKPLKLVSKNVQTFTVSSLSLLLVGFVFRCCYFAYNPDPNLTQIISLTSSHLLIYCSVGFIV